VHFPDDCPKTYTEHLFDDALKTSNYHILSLITFATTRTSLQQHHSTCIEAFSIQYPDYTLRPQSLPLTSILERELMRGPFRNILAANRDQVLGRETEHGRFRHSR